MDTIHMIYKKETRQVGSSEKHIPCFAPVCGIPGTDQEAFGHCARALPALPMTATIGWPRTQPVLHHTAPALPDDQLTADHAAPPPANWLSRGRAPSAPTLPWMIRPLNVAELDPRDEWWADLCAEVAQAAPAHLDSLVAPASDAAPAAPLEPSSPAVAEDSIGSYGSGTSEEGELTPEDRS